MFCKNCGAQLNPNAAVCTQCGVAVGNGVSFCPNCGAGTAPGAAVCTQCGVALINPVVAQPAVPVGAQQKSKLAGGLLGIFLGSLGVHNFYLGYTGKAVAQLLISLLSCGTLAAVSGVWGLIEGIMILTGSIGTDGKGVPLKD